MQRWVEGWPVWAVFGFLFTGALSRGIATYWVGRSLRAGGEQSRWARHLDRPIVVVAERWLHQVGPVLVPVGFLTVGIQSAINGAAGASRMPARRFGPALVVGAGLWAGLYTLVGLAVAEAIIGRLSWWVAAGGLALLIATVIASRVISARARHDASRGSDDNSGRDNGHSQDQVGGRQSGCGR